MAGVNLTRSPAGHTQGEADALAVDALEAYGPYIQWS